MSSDLVKHVCKTLKKIVGSIIKNKEKMEKHPELEKGEPELESDETDLLVKLVNAYNNGNASDSGNDSDSSDTKKTLDEKSLIKQLEACDLSDYKPKSNLVKKDAMEIKEPNVKSKMKTITLYLKKSKKSSTTTKDECDDLTKRFTRIKLTNEKVKSENEPSDKKKSHNKNAHKESELKTSDVKKPNKYLSRGPIVKNSNHQLFSPYTTPNQGKPVQSCVNINHLSGGYTVRENVNFIEASIPTVVNNEFLTITQNEDLNTIMDIISHPNCNRDKETIDTLSDAGYLELVNSLAGTDVDYINGMNSNLLFNFISQIDTVNSDPLPYSNSPIQETLSPMQGNLSPNQGNISPMLGYRSPGVYSESENNFYDSITSRTSSESNCSIPNSPESSIPELLDETNSLTTFHNVLNLENDDWMNMIQHPVTNVMQNQPSVIKPNDSEYVSIAPKLRLACCSENLHRRSARYKIHELFLALDESMQKRMCIIVHESTEHALQDMFDTLLSTWNDDTAISSQYRLPLLHVVCTRLLMKCVTMDKFTEIYRNGHTILDRAVLNCYNSPLVARYLAECMIKVKHHIYQTACQNHQNNDSMTLRENILHRTVTRSDQYADSLVGILEENARSVLKILNINATNNEGDTPLHMICKNPKKSKLMLHVLLKHGHADPNITTSNSGDTPLHNVVNSYDCDPDLVSLLLQAGAKVSVKNHANSTPLELAKRAAKNCNNPKHGKHIVTLLKNVNTKR